MLLLTKCQPHDWTGLERSCIVLAVITQHAKTRIKCLNGRSQSWTVSQKWTQTNWRLSATQKSASLCHKNQGCILNTNTSCTSSAYIQETKEGYANSILKQAGGGLPAAKWVLALFAPCLLALAGSFWFGYHMYAWCFYCMGEIESLWSRRLHMVGCQNRRRRLSLTECSENHATKHIPFSKTNIATSEETPREHTWCLLW